MEFNLNVFGSSVPAADDAQAVFTSLIVKTVIRRVDCAKEFITGHSGEKESGLRFYGC